MSIDRPLDGIVFDLGGTLIYLDAPVPQVYASADLELFLALEQAGLILDRDQFLQTYRGQMDAYYRERQAEFIEHTAEYVLRTILAGWGYPDVPEGVLKPALQRFFATTREHWQPEADAIATLDTLQKQGYRLGLISNASDAADVQALVDKAGLRPYLDPVLVSVEAGVRKPNPAIFQHLLRQWGIQPQRAAMVGDTLGADILGAKNAGMRSIWIERRANTAANRAHAGTIIPDARIQTLGELPGLLAQMEPL